MKYMGSKARIAKHILPIMLAECEKHGITTWVEPFCLAKTTKVFTRDGIKTLSDVEVGDFIYSDSCDLVKIVNKVESCKTQGLKITLKGNVKIDTTEDHLFYLNDGKDVKAGDIRIGDILLSGSSSEKPNIVLDLAQFITVENKDLRGSRGGVVYDDYVKVYHNAPKIRRFVTIDEDFCWALGLVIAEGSKKAISLHEDEVCVANKFLDIYKKITGLEFENTDKFYFREDVKSLHVAMPSPKIYEALFFKACGIGYGARNKSMAIGFEMSELLILKLIQGMHVGDGCTLLKGKYKSWNYKTSSETLAYQLQAILSTKLNIKSTLSQGMNKERYIGNRLLKESNYFNISVNHSSDIATLEGVEVGNIFQEKQKGFVVTNIEPSVNTYYDITLQDGSSHRFIIDGGIVTHNCGGGNMIDKVPDTFERIGYDLNDHAIHALIDIRDRADSLPDSVSEEEYKSFYNKPAEHFSSLVRFGASFGGKFENGFARGKAADGSARNYWSETKRNALKQSPKIQNVEFICESYENLSFENCLVYCFNENTELLTDKGWLNIKDITTDDNCLSREPNSSKLEYKKVVKTHQTKSQRMFYYKSKMLDFSITDDHNMFVNKKLGRIGNRKDLFVKPKDLDNYNFQFINAGGIWNGVTPTKMHVGEFEVDTLLFMYLLGIFFSDGSVNKQKSVTIVQKKPKIVEKIRENLDKLGLPYSEYLSNKNGVSTFYFKKSWSTYFEQFYLKKERKIPREILNFGTDALEKLLEGILDGDSDNERRRVYTGSMTSVNDIQEILYKCGFASNYKIMKPKNSKLSCGRVIVGNEYYVVNILKTEYLDASEKNAHFVDEEKDVYCVTLEEWHTVLTRQNGKVIWLGQCDPPYQGTTGYKTGAFDHDKFFEWCREQAKSNVVFVSEYNAPDDFELVWQGEIKTNFSSTRKKATHNAVEKLFKVRG